MRLRQKIILSLSAVVSTFWAAVAAAQFLEGAAAPSAAPARQPAASAAHNTYSVVEPVKIDRSQATDGASAFENFGNAVPTRRERAAGSNQQPNNREQLQQEEEKPSVYRQVGHVTMETKDEDEDVQLIFLYMKNFEVYRSPSGQTRCSMRFAIVTTLPDKLSALSCRLKWPKMETTLNFIEVQPDVENHFDYTLLGDGCYNMSAQPNIVVNRCRAKGISQRSCAGKIRWITERK